MDPRHVLIKVLHFLMIVFPQTAAVTHTLQYLYTAITPRINVPEFTVVGLVDREQFVYYDSDIGKAFPQMEWILGVSVDDRDYRNPETRRMQSNQDDFQHLLLTVMEEFNHTEGVHTLQRMYGCELYDNGTTRGYDQYGYDGEDFISLDLSTETWTAANDKAVTVKDKWEEIGAGSSYWKYYLKNDCVYWLRNFVSYGRETLERRVPPEVSVFQKHLSPEVVCHATGFLPIALNIIWQKNGEYVYEGVEFRETLLNQDGSFQMRSILKVSAEELQKYKYTCVIQHSSLEKDLVLPVSERRILRGGVPIGIIAAEVACLVAVVVIFAENVWKRKRKCGLRDL